MTIFLGNIDNRGSTSFILERSAKMFSVFRDSVDGTNEIDLTTCFEAQVLKSTFAILTLCIIVIANWFVKHNNTIKIKSNKYFWF